MLLYIYIYILAGKIARKDFQVFFCVWWLCLPHFQVFFCVVGLFTAKHPKPTISRRRRALRRGVRSHGVSIAPLSVHRGEPVTRGVVLCLLVPQRLGVGRRSHHDHLSRHLRFDRVVANTLAARLRSVNRGLRRGTGFN